MWIASYFESVCHWLTQAFSPNICRQNKRWQHTKKWQCSQRIIHLRNESGGMFFSSQQSSYCGNYHLSHSLQFFMFEKQHNKPCGEGFLSEDIFVIAFVMFNMQLLFYYKLPSIKLFFSFFLKKERCINLIIRPSKTIKYQLVGLQKLWYTSLWSLFAVKATYVSLL